MLSGSACLHVFTFSPLLRAFAFLGYAPDLDLDFTCWSVASRSWEICALLVGQTKHSSSWVCTELRMVRVSTRGRPYLDSFLRDERFDYCLQFVSQFVSCVARGPNLPLTLAF